MTASPGGLCDEAEEFVDCPVCLGTGTLRVASTCVDLPHEGRVLLVALRCLSCGYRTTELVSLERGGPSVLSMRVRGEEGLRALVYVGPGSIVSVPELGLELEVKERSQGFVTTVEGVLERFLEAAELLCRGQSSEGCGRVLEGVRELIRGGREFTLIIEDPSGRSRIVHRTG